MSNNELKYSATIPAYLRVLFALIILFSTCASLYLEQQNWEEDTIVDVLDLEDESDSDEEDKDEKEEKEEKEEMEDEFFNTLNFSKISISARSYLREEIHDNMEHIKFEVPVPPPEITV